MRSNKFLTAVLLIFAAATASAQEEFTSRPTGRGNHSLVAYVSGGSAYYLSSSGFPAYLRPQVTKWNPVGTVRIMWHPDHLLKVGLETGRITFYSYKLEDSTGREGRIALQATPILLEWSMSLKDRINIFAGSGLYILNSSLDYQGETKNTKLSVGWMAAVSYIYPLGKTVGLGAEAKWLYASETANGSIGGQLQLVWRFLKW